MFRRSGTSQEEPEAGGEYKRTSALLCVHVSSTKTSHLILLLPFSFYGSLTLIIFYSFFLYALIASESLCSFTVLLPRRYPVSN